MSNVYDVLNERGYIAQITDEDAVRKLLSEERITFYIGFDPTADSLHVGHFVALMVMAHMQRAGHKPIALLGGGTAMVGDPSGKTDMRRMMTVKTIEHNAGCFKTQMSKLVDFSEGKAEIVNNGDWLLGLNYIEFLRDIGAHFSVNRMLAAECFKQRLEKGLTFLEFNYMLMQGYDFYYLFKNKDCRMQLGGDDQWSNILGGIDLVRKKEQAEVYGMTFKLLTTSEGKKMGKTEKGAVWLDPAKTSPFDFYQYWRNTADPDVINCMKLLTFVPMDEVNEYAKLRDVQINEAKKRLAYEVTAIVHGTDEAEKCAEQARALFEAGGRSDDMPSTRLSDDERANGIGILDLMLKAGLIPSKGEGRRLVMQGGVYLNDTPVSDPALMISGDTLTDGELIIRKGKKVFHRII
ncbi:MAG: tyrosine--tRNA ligase [Eubacteriales bacterium]|nr:tyrosine--tRNA ligase [Eubacteriales bacterium]